MVELQPSKLMTTGSIPAGRSTNMSIADLYYENTRNFESKRYEEQQMNYSNKITSQIVGELAVKQQKFIIGSIDPIKGLVSFSTNPALHEDVFTARAECKRLAVANHAEMYGIYPENCRPDDLDEEDDDGDSYSDNIEGYFEDYDPEKHDGLRVGGDESWEVFR